MNKSTAILAGIVALQGATLWLQDRRLEGEIKMASGNYILAAIISKGPKAGRHIFCCREGEASKVVPLATPYHVELATKDEAKKYIEQNGTDGHWVRIE